jgi:hypothetical protein
MRTAAICPTCATYENAVCVLYNGELLDNIDVSPLDSMEVALEKIDTAVADVIALVNNTVATPFVLTTDGFSGPADLTTTQNIPVLNIPDYTITLTTNGTSGPATLVDNELNIPEYEFSLQDVLDINSTATTAINIEDAVIESVNAAGTNSAGLDGVNGNVYIKTGGGQFASISATNVTGSAKALQLPNVNGTLVASVNGVTPNAITGNVQVTANLPYQVWVGIITAGVGTAVNVQQIANTIGTMSYPTFNTTPDTYYTVVLNGAFPQAKTVVLCGHPASDDANRTVKAYRSSDDLIKIVGYTGGVVDNTSVVGIPIEIRVYP